jgi:hypothetical protein
MTSQRRNGTFTFAQRQAASDPTKEYRSLRACSPAPTTLDQAVDPADRKALPAATDQQIGPAWAVKGQLQMLLNEREREDPGLAGPGDVAVAGADSLDVLVIQTSAVS